MENAIENPQPQARDDAAASATGQMQVSQMQVPQAQVSQMQVPQAQVPIPPMPPTMDGQAIAEMRERLESLEKQNSELIEQNKRLFDTISEQVKSGELYGSTTAPTNAPARPQGADAPVEYTPLRKLDFSMRENKPN